MSSIPPTFTNITTQSMEPLSSQAQPALETPVNASQYTTWTSVKQLKTSQIVAVLNAKGFDVEQSLVHLLGEGKIRNSRSTIKSNLEQVWKHNKIGITETGRNPRLYDEEIYDFPILINVK
jgi:hypothetical protein